MARPSCNTSAPWIPTLAFAPTWIAPPPTPTFRSPSAFRLSLSAEGAPAAEPTPRRNGTCPRAAISASSASFSLSCCSCRILARPPGDKSPSGGGRGAARQHHRVGHHLRAGEGDAARRLSLTAARVPFFPGIGDSAGPLPRKTGFALDGPPSGHPHRNLPLRWLRPADRGTALYHRAQVSLRHR